LNKNAAQAIFPMEDANAAAKGTGP